MNFENALLGDTENYFGVKFIREKYSHERMRTLRNKFVGEARKKIENFGFQNNPIYIDIIQKLQLCFSTLGMNEKLKTNQNKEIKQLLIYIQGLCKKDEKLFTFLTENDSFLSLHKCILEHRYCSLELKHEALWNVAIASNYKLTQERTDFLVVPVVYITSELFQLPRVDQLIFLEKILYCLTNFLIDHPCLTERLKGENSLHKLSSSMLSEHNSDHISLALWFTRILLKSSKTTFQESLADYSIQHSIMIALNKYSNDSQLLFELLWTLTHISEVQTDYEIIGFDLISGLIDIASCSDEKIVLPILSIIGNAFTSLKNETIQAILEKESFTNLLQVALLSKNIIIKREGIFLISNMAAKSAQSAFFIVQRNDLMEFLINIIKYQEAYVLKDALYAAYNLCFVCSNMYPDLKNTMNQVFYSIKEAGGFKNFDQEIGMLQDKFCELFASNE